MPVIDFNAAMQQAKSASFEPLPPGEYNMVCIETTPTESSTGKPMIKARWQVEDGPQQGKKAFDQYVFSADSDNALSFFFQHMRYFGLDETFFAANPSWETVAQSIVGRRCRMQLGIREWNGRTQNDVERIMPPSTPSATGGVPGMQQQVPMTPQLPQQSAPQFAPQPAAQPQVAAPAAAPVQPAPQPGMPEMPTQQPTAQPEPQPQVQQPQPLQEVPAPQQPQPLQPQMPAAPQMPQMPQVTTPPLPQATPVQPQPAAPNPTQFQVYEGGQQPQPQPQPAVQAPQAPDQEPF